MALKDWRKITKQPKSKAWISAEFSNKGQTILVYDDKQYGWRVWIGNTDGSNNGKYHTFKSRIEALKFAKSYMRKTIKWQSYIQ